MPGVPGALAREGWQPVLALQEGGQVSTLGLLAVLLAALVLLAITVTGGRPEDHLPCPDTAPTEVVACLPPRSR